MLDLIWRFYGLLDEKKRTRWIFRCLYCKLCGHRPIVIVTHRTRGRCAFNISHSTCQYLVLPSYVSACHLLHSGTRACNCIRRKQHPAWERVSITRSVGDKQEPYHSGPEWELIVRDLINRKETVYVFPQCQLLSVMTQSDDLSNIVLRRDGVSTLDEGWSRRRTYRVGNLLCARLISCACRPISSAPVDITRNYAPAPASN